MASYIFENIGGYVLITKRDGEGKESKKAIPAGVYSILPHISIEDNICIIGDIKTEAEQSLSSFNEELKLSYKDIIQPVCINRIDAIYKLTAIFSNNGQKAPGLGVYSTEFELSAISLGNKIFSVLEEMLFYLKKISD